MRVRLNMLKPANKINEDQKELVIRVLTVINLTNKENAIKENANEILKRFIDTHFLTKQI